MYICICNAVTDRQIRQAVELGCNSIKRISRELGVARCCGKCAEEACRVIDEHIAELHNDCSPQGAEERQLKSA